MSEYDALTFLFNPFETYHDIVLKATNHPPTNECADQECLVCGYRDCPFHDPLHYHHDGCPSEYLNEIELNK